MSDTVLVLWIGHDKILVGYHLLSCHKDTIRTLEIISTTFTGLFMVCSFLRIKSVPFSQTVNWTAPNLFHFPEIQHWVIGAWNDCTCRPVRKYEVNTHVGERYQYLPWKMHCSYFTKRERLQSWILINSCGNGSCCGALLLHWSLISISAEDAVREYYFSGYCC